jgi:hypothetical protein
VPVTDGTYSVDVSLYSSVGASSETATFSPELLPLRCPERPAPTSRCLAAALLLVCTAALATPARAQVPDSIKKQAAQDTLSAIKDTIKQEARQEVVATAHVIRWYEVAAAAGGVAALTVLDFLVSKRVKDRDFYAFQVFAFKGTFDMGHGIFFLVFGKKNL